MPTFDIVRLHSIPDWLIHGLAGSGQPGILSVTGRTSRVEKNDPSASSEPHASAASMRSMSGSALSQLARQITDNRSAGTRISSVSKPHKPPL